MQRQCGKTVLPRRQVMSDGVDGNSNSQLRLVIVKITVELLLGTCYVLEVARNAQKTFHK